MHAKLYVFGSSSAVVTSANLTKAALDRNQEFGILLGDQPDIATCVSYFDRLWACAGENLSAMQVESWNAIVARERALAKSPGSDEPLADFGAIVDDPAAPLVDLPAVVTDAPQAFVKFLGEGRNRVPDTFMTTEEVDRAGCHWALAYPASKRPVGVQDDALMFIGRLTKSPNDIRVFGRAVAIKYKPGRDDATPEDINLRSWKRHWPRYIRVHSAVFVAGSMANGISLNQLMDSLGPNAYATTQWNSVSNSGNTDPRRAYGRQPAVELSGEGREWLSDRLQRAFEQHGTIPQDALDNLDWPILPGGE